MYKVKHGTAVSEAADLETARAIAKEAAEAGNVAAIFDDKGELVSTVALSPVEVAAKPAKKRK